ncbi:MAG: DUF3445 domain-containing protein [Paracoccaceae bacterium]
MLVLHAALPFKVWMDPVLSRLPGIQPLDPEDWLRVDDAYAGQMAERERLISTHPDLVHALLPHARPAAEELLEVVLDRLSALGFTAEGQAWRCPDGRLVNVDHAHPLLTLGRLLQNDFCLLHEGPEGHILTGAILCFPASWTLAQKLGRNLLGIHVPVAGYDTLAPRVQRLFDAIRPERPLWRANVLDYVDPALFQPRREDESRPRREDGAFIRSERQCLLRLPRSNAVVFSIHTYLVRRDTLTAEEEAAFKAYLSRNH